jgi:HEAT repeat protein
VSRSRPATGVVLALLLLAGQVCAESAVETLRRALKKGATEPRVAALQEAARSGARLSAEERRQTTLLLRKVLGADGDPLVRQEVVRTLAALHDEAAWVPVLVAATSDRDDAVRRVAVEAVLTAKGDVLPVAKKLLKEDQDPTFRAEVCLLLGRRQRLDAAPILLEALADTHPRVQSAAGEGLEAVSGEAHGWDAKAWARWWEKAKPGAAPAAVPRPGETVTSTPQAPELPPPPPPPKGLVPELYGLPLRAKDYVFVIDVSGSIGADGLATAKSELVKAVERLGSDVRIAALFFDEEVRTWHPEMTPATPAAKDELAKFVRGIGRGSRTDIMTPLNAGLAMVRRRVAERVAAKDPAPEPVTMVVVSDGQENVKGTPGEVVGDKLDRLDLSQSVVHAICVGGRGSVLMEALARRAGGFYVVVP